MPKDGQTTRNKILTETNSLVLENGFAGTTIDHILDRTQITKGAFFYHFKSKADLAYHLMQDFARRDVHELHKALDQVNEVIDSRSRMLAFVQIFVDIMSGLESPYPGCLYASYVYEPQQFSQEIKDMVSDSILVWRGELVKMIEATIRSKEPIAEIDVESLADHFTVILEGAYIVSKALNDPGLTAKQLIHFKTYLELLFRA